MVAGNVILPDDASVFWRFIKLYCNQASFSCLEHGTALKSGTKSRPCFKKSGHRSVTVEYPSTKGDPSISFSADYTNAPDITQAELNKGHDVIIVCHAYGTHVGQSVLKEPPTTVASRSRIPQDQGQDKEGGKKVPGLVLMGTGFNRTGLSVLEFFDEKPPPIWSEDKENGFAELIVPNMTGMFYNGLPLEEGKAWSAKL